ncbi:hypothetical protein P3W45_001662 [Vairimorpha bombi]|jgi:hypothetical protein
MIFIPFLSFCEPSTPVYLFSVDTNIILLLSKYCEMNASICINEYRPNEYIPVQYLKQVCSINEEKDIIKEILANFSEDIFNVQDWLIFKQKKEMFKKDNIRYALAITEDLSNFRFNFVLPDNFLQEKYKIKLINYKIDGMFLKLIYYEIDYLIRNLEDLFVKICKTDIIDIEVIKLKIVKDMPKAKQTREIIRNILEQIKSVNRKFDILKNKVGLINHIRRDMELNHLIKERSDQIGKIIRTHKLLKKNIISFTKKVMLKK